MWLLKDKKGGTPIETKINSATLTTAIFKFISYNNSIDSTRQISFWDANTFLGREANYKSKAAELAKDELRYWEWQEDWIGSGKILLRVRRAVNKAGGLVSKGEQLRFRSIMALASRSSRYSFRVTEAGVESIEASLEEAETNVDKHSLEEVLYRLFRDRGAEKEVFESAVAILGPSYDLISYLFFVKDSSRFLPIGPLPSTTPLSALTLYPGDMDEGLEDEGSGDEETGDEESDGAADRKRIRLEKSLSLLGVDYVLTCTWENYVNLMEIVKEIRVMMQDIIPTVDIRLIDAHSFLDVIGTTSFKRYKDPDIEMTVESYLSGRGKKRVREENEVDRLTRQRAGGICELCGNPAPFNSPDGTPYLETHHIVWLSKGGKDEMDNTAALCPNCHTKMHVVEDKGDVRKLKRVRKENRVFPSI